jgi:hypothetical protein
VHLVFSSCLPPFFLTPSCQTATTFADMKRRRKHRLAKKTSNNDNRNMIWRRRWSLYPEWPVAQHDWTMSCWWRWQWINMICCTLLVMLTIGLFVVALGFCLMRLVAFAPPRLWYAFGHEHTSGWLMTSMISSKLKNNSYELCVYISRYMIIYTWTH